MGQGSKEHDLLGEFMMILVNWSSVTVEKVKNLGKGDSGVMCCKSGEVGKVECIFSIFSCEEVCHLKV